MNENQTNQPNEKIRPTKKQHELLGFIEAFIAEHGYSPSYREIMTGLNYNSVATVALHVNSLIKRGQLKKRDKSARSLEVAKPTSPVKLATNQIHPGEEKWLVEKADYLFKQAEQSSQIEPAQIDQLQILLAALKILGLPAAAQSFNERLAKLRKDTRTE